MRTKSRSFALAALLAVGVLALVAAGCGSGGNESAGNTGGGGSTANTGATGSKVKVCLVTDIGGLNDRGFNALANEALEKAASDLGVQTRVLESKSDADYIPNLSQCGSQGYDLVVSNGYLMGDATEAAAKQFPDTTFAIIDYAYDKPESNLQGLVFKEQEVGYLVGYVAGLVTKSNTVSTVGGQKIPPVDRFIAGYRKGVADANPKAKELNGYSQDFSDQAKCKEIALDQISKGSDVVFQVAGGCGLGALDAAKQKGVWGIGVDKDQSFLGDHILTSAVKRVDQAVYQTIEKVVNGEKVGGGTTVFGLAEDAVGLGKVSSKVPKDVIDKVDAQKQKVINGEIKIPDTVK